MAFTKYTHAWDKKQITVLACCSAAGYVLPPLVVFSRKSLYPNLTIGEIPGTMYGLSDNSWLDGEIFENWFTHHFLVHTPGIRPFLLLLDGHSTHYNHIFIRRAAQEKIVVFFSPSNTTHLTKPLDKGAFGPLKTCWNQACQEYMRKNPGKVVTQYEFMSVPSAKLVGPCQWSMLRFPSKLQAYILWIVVLFVYWVHVYHPSLFFFHPYI